MDQHNVFGAISSSSILPLILYSTYYSMVPAPSGPPHNNRNELGMLEKEEKELALGCKSSLSGWGRGDSSQPASSATYCPPWKESRGRIFKEFRNLESIPWSWFQLRNQFQVGINSKGWSRVGTGYTLFHLGTGLDLIPVSTRWKANATFKN